MPRKTTSSSKTTSLAEKRDQGIRVDAKQLVPYRQSGNYLFDFSHSISQGGIFLETNEPKELGSKIELTFSFPGNKKEINAQGQVVWIQEALADREDCVPGMGVQFIKLEDADRVKLHDFVNSKNQ